MQLVHVDDGARADDHLRHFLCHLGDGVLGRGGAEGDLHGVDAARQQRLRGGHGLFRVFQYHHRHDAAGGNLFDIQHSNYLLCF